MGKLEMGLRASGHFWNIMAMYGVTMIMRASFYISIAVIGSSSYMGSGLQTLEITAVLLVYPVAELTSVSFFGSYSDKIGRKPIFVASLFITSLSALLFAVANSLYILLVFSAVFGLGAASQVSTTLSMVADMSSETNRARLMGYYDLSTLFGLAGGYSLGILLLHFGWTPFTILLAAASAAAFAGLAAVGLIKETRTETHVGISITGLIRKVAGDKRIQKLVPVYVPIISMYGIFIGYSERILEAEFKTLAATDLLILFGMLGGSLVIGIITMSHLSDHYMKRRPFIVVGLLGFGILAYLLVSNSANIAALWAVWPILPILGFVAGAFPPAAMAYLTDVSDRDARGTTMGVYSIFFGTGMIIGPASGGFVYTWYGIVGLAILVASFIAVAIVGTYFMSEPRARETIPDDELRLSKS
jgi:MFS family permease